MGFGDALTAALDVMAFAPDFDLSIATENVPANIDAKQTKTQPKAVSNDQTKTTENNSERVTIIQPRTQYIEEEIKLSALTDLIDKSVDSVNVEAMNLKNTNREYRYAVCMYTSVYK